jgi:hypothetical protein
VGIRVVQAGGSVDISLVSRDRRTPNTILRVPHGASIEVDPTGEEAEFTPVPLKLFVELVNRSLDKPDRIIRLRPKNPATVQIGNWRYEVSTLRLDATDVPPTYITPSTLTAIRLPGLLQRALRPLVALVDEEGSYTLGSDDPDDRAVLAYVVAVMTHDNPTTAVATELGTNPNAAAQRVYRLRRSGRLPSTTKGKK